MQKAFFQLENYSSGYDKTIINNNISFSVNRGEIVSIIGPNGAGKTTLLRTITRQLAPLGGTAFLNGSDLSCLPRKDLARQMSIVSTSRVSSELMTVEDIVSSGRYPYTGRFGTLSENDHRIVQKAMSAVHISELADKDFDCISDGQRQRVLLARALAQEPEILIMDEPTAFLDIRYKLEFLQTVRDLARSTGLTVIMSMHEIDLAQKVSDKVACLNASGLDTFGTPEDVFRPGYIETLFSMNVGSYDVLTGSTSLGDSSDTSCRPFEHYIVSGGKKLRCGFTTGTCAALAATACIRRLLRGQWPESVSLMTPKGLRVEVVPENCRIEGTAAVCSIRKYAGDDADQTSGLLIEAQVRPNGGTSVIIDGAKGVGRVTLPGLDQPVGAAAINHVPREMITAAVENECRLNDTVPGYDVIISVPDGEEAAKKTFNPSLGIVGGISILGTSGIVEPMSLQALCDSIEVELRSCAARGFRRLILTPGNYGMDYLRSIGFDGTDIPIVKCSNFIGEALDHASLLGFEQVLLFGHVGKLCKLAGGIMNTHSSVADCRTELFCTYAAVNGASPEICRELLYSPTTDACLDILKENGLFQSVMADLINAVDLHLQRRVKGAFEVGAVLFSLKEGELGRTAETNSILDHWKARSSE